MNHLQHICLSLAENDIEYCILSRKASILYTTGLPPTHPTEREAYVFISPSSILLYHSPFVIPPSLSESIVAGRTYRTVAMSTSVPLSDVIKAQFHEAKLIGIEAEDFTVAERERFITLVGTTCNTVAIDTVVKTTQIVKDADEQQKITKAIRITKKVISWIDNFIHTPSSLGITESQLKHLVEAKFYEFGATGLAFPTIVAFDDHTASPHHVSSHRKLKPTSVVLVDLGAAYQYYNADMTRTWCLDQPSSLYTKIEKIVKSAYKAAFTVAVTHKVTRANEVDQAARSVIADAGYGPNFIHTTGHGIGIDAHEMPSLNLKNDLVLKSGMVITIEPGIYLPDKLGYRYENTIIL